MTNWIDFKELRKQLDFGQVLKFYGAELKPRGDQLHGFCPLPKHKGTRSSPSFSANLKRGIFQCFGCGGKGNLLDFAVLMDEGDPKKGDDVQKTAVKLAVSFLGGRPPTLKQGATLDQSKPTVNAPLDFSLKGLDARHPYLASRGLTNETIDRFELGYCSRGILAKRIAIPIHDASGNLVGYAGRVVDDNAITEENPKYRFPGSRKRDGVVHEFRKSLLLYNERRLDEGLTYHTRQVDDLVVVEGFVSTWWLSQAGITDVVALMGASCSKKQAQRIVSRVNEDGRVWVFTDGDEAGARCAGEIIVHVTPHRFVRWVRLEKGKQPTDYGREELKKLLPFPVHESDDEE